MIVSRTVNIVVNGMVVASCKYESPMDHEQQLEMYLFIAAAFATYPTAAIECINEKIGSNKFPSTGGGDDNLFSV